MVRASLEHGDGLAEAKGRKMAYVLVDGLLMRRWSGGNPDEDWSVVHQVVATKDFWYQVLMLAHVSPC